MSQGQNKLSVVEEKLITLKERELEDVRQEHEKLQGALEDQKENKEALMKEILEKMVYTEEIKTKSFQVYH